MSRERVECPEHVGHAGDADQFDPVEQPVEVVEVEPAVVVDRYPAKVDAALFGQHLPRDDVGVVLHLGQHDGVAGVQVGRPQVWATRLTASVAFLVKTISRAGSGAPMKRPTSPGAPRKRRVASSAMVYTPRWTLAWVVSS